jgi:hypothetical protein
MKKYRSVVNNFKKISSKKLSLKGILELKFLYFYNLQKFNVFILIQRFYNLKLYDFHQK